MYLFNSRKLFSFINKRRLSSCKVMFDIKTFVFLDSETTGLPFMENNRTRITELCLVAVQAGHIELGVFPRVLNKLNFCFNPSKIILPECTQLTGLSNEMLENQSTFSVKTLDTIVNFLESSRSPICLVAHNGYKFDYPILKAELNRVQGSLPQDILCMDSLEAFRFLETNPLIEQKVEQSTTNIPFEFDDDYDEILCQIADELEGSPKKKLSVEEIQKVDETTPEKQIIGDCSLKKVVKYVENTKSKKTSNSENNSPKLNLTKSLSNPTIGGRKSYKLVDIYKRLICKPPVMAHEAEGDVTMLITCAAVFGEKFVDYANNNCKYFRDIPMMVPGKRIGS